MSIYFSGTYKRSGGLISAISKQLKQINLKPIKRITFTFDPFGVEHGKSTREFLFHLSSPKVIQTNPKCILKTDVVCNRLPSEIKFQLIPEVQDKIQAKEIRFISENLTSLELLQLFNKHISVLAPEEDIKTSSIQTKSAKKSITVGKSKKLIKKK